MHVMFIARGWENFGISQLSSIVQAYGHSVSLGYSPGLFDDTNYLHVPCLADHFDDTHIILKEIEKNRPDVLAFSVITATYQWSLRIAREAKALMPDVPVIFGGIHASAVPEELIVQKCIDYVCIGEADHAFPVLLDALAHQEPVHPIINTWGKTSEGRVIKGPQTGFIRNLDNLPFFDKPLWEDHMQMHLYYITTTSRGCPFQCSFCFNSYYSKLAQNPAGPYVRRRGVDHVIQELSVARNRYQPKMIEFFDDIFTLNKPWLKNFLEKYKQTIRIPFQIFTHVNYVDEEVAAWLNEAGCLSAQIGLQSLDQKYKKQHLNRFETNQQASLAIQSLKKHHIQVKIDHMFGLPQEPMEAQEKARKFYQDNVPYRIQTYWTNYYPRTELIRTAINADILSREDAESIRKGLSFDSFTYAHHKIDRAKIKTYQSFCLLFKLLPILPGPVRSKVSVKIFKIFPQKVLSMISFFIDLCVGVIQMNPDHWQYSRYYLHHIKRFYRVRRGKQTRPASKIYSTEMFNRFSTNHETPVGKVKRRKIWTS
jgi:radical SAM superfamily enzyme YgiQ (UPF0313 family)